MRFAVTARTRTGHTRGRLLGLLPAAALLAGCAAPGGSGAQAATGAASPTSPSQDGTGQNGTGQNGTGLVAADTEKPSSSVCGTASGPFAVVETNPSAPAPRCVIVQPGQQLRVVNTSDRDESSGRTVTVTFADWPARTVRLHKATTFERDFGDYLAPGVHDLRVSLYAGSGTEIWLKR